MVAAVSSEVWWPIVEAWQQTTGRTDWHEHEEREKRKMERILELRGLDLAESGWRSRAAAAKYYSLTWDTIHAAVHGGGLPTKRVPGRAHVLVLCAPSLREKLRRTTHSE